MRTGCFKPGQYLANNEWKKAEVVVRKLTKLYTVSFGAVHSMDMRIAAQMAQQQWWRFFNSKQTKFEKLSWHGSTKCRIKPFEVSRRINANRMIIVLGYHDAEVTQPKKDLLTWYIYELRTSETNWAKSMWWLISSLKPWRTSSRRLTCSKLVARDKKLQEVLHGFALRNRSFVKSPGLDKQCDLRLVRLSTYWTLPT